MEAILLGTALLVASVVIGTFAAVVTVRAVAGLFHRGYGGPSLSRNLLILIVATLIAAVNHMVNIGLWAAVFLLCGEFDHFERAFYHSAGNYTTLGYGDIVMSPRWRMLGPLEAVNGVMMLGLSTAVLFAVLERLMTIRLRRGKGGNDGERNA
jgi:hypothetical protein